MKHKFGFKQTFFALMLAAAGVFGVTASLMTRSNNFEKVEALNTSDDYILDINSGGTDYWTCGLLSNAGTRNQDGVLKRDKSDNSQIFINDISVVTNQEFWARWWYSGHQDATYTKHYKINASNSTWTGDGSSNLKCTTAGVYDMYFKPQVKDDYNNQGVIYVNWGTVTVNKYYVDSSGATVKASESVSTTSENSFAAPNIPSIAGYNSPTKWKVGSRTGSDYSAQRLTSVTVNLYAVYTAKANVTITYSYKSTDNESLTGTPTSASQKPDLTVTLPSCSISNYNFYGWYTSYSSGVFSGTHYNGGASYTVTGATTLYAKYVRNGYAYLLGSFNSWNETSTYRFSDGPETGYRHYKYSFSQGDKFWIRYASTSGAGSDGLYHASNKNAQGDASGCFSADGDNNFVCDTAGTYDILLHTDSGNVYIYHGDYQDAGYYMSGVGTFGNPDWAISSGMKMTENVGGNTAVLENGTTGISVAADSRFKVVNHANANSNTWYAMTLGGSYSFAELHSDTGGNSVKIKTAGSYNFYFKIVNDVNYIYIVDVSEIANAGTLYLTSPQGTIGNITVSTTNTKGEHQFTDAALSSVSGTAKESTTIKFGDGYIYSIPLFNLRGNDSGSPCTTVTFSWNSPSSGSVTLTGVDSLGGSAQHYYIERSTSSVSEPKYSAIQLIFDIETAINATGDNKTVCEVPKATAESLCSRYDTLAASISELPIATLHTWASTVGDGGADIAIRDLRYELGNRAGGTYKISRAGSFSPINIFGLDEDGNNFATIIIIVASSISLLSITALSVLVIKKRKEKQ